MPSEPTNQPADPADRLVYVVRGGSCYHYRQHLQWIKAERIPESRARALGYQPCPICVLSAGTDDS